MTADNQGTITSLVKRLIPDGGGSTTDSEWDLSGDYVEACNCDVACQCIWLDPPNDDACTASLAWHIQDGQYGDIDLSGLSVGMLIRTEEGVMFDPDTAWHVVLLIDEAADDEQRAALETIYSGQAGGIFGPVADTHVKTAEVATVPITFTRDDTTFSVTIDETVSMEAVETTGFNDEPSTISPHPLTQSLEMNIGKSTTANVSYNDAFTWEVGGGNSYLGDFELANA